jgi:hypothetical protein
MAAAAQWLQSQTQLDLFRFVRICSDMIGFD